MSNWKIIWSEDIQSWIDRQTIKKFLERELTKTFDNFSFTTKVAKSEEKGRKVYYRTEEIDGSTVILVNDRWLEDIVCFLRTNSDTICTDISKHSLKERRNDEQ